MMMVVMMIHKKDMAAAAGGGAGKTDVTRHIRREPGGSGAWGVCPSGPSKFRIQKMLAPIM